MSFVHIKCIIADETFGPLIKRKVWKALSALYWALQNTRSFLLPNQATDPLSSVLSLLIGVALQGLRAGFPLTLLSVILLVVRD